MEDVKQSDNLLRNDGPRCALVTEPVLQPGEHTAKVVCTVRNVSPRDCHTLEVQFALFDEEGNATGTARDLIRGLPAGGAHIVWASGVVTGKVPVRCELVSLQAQ